MGGSWLLDPRRYRLGSRYFHPAAGENGNRVFGVEPNPDMRSAGEEYLAGYPKFASVSGTAEATTLPDHRVTLITSAQAAHWFDREKALLEFRRILCPGGYVALLCNERHV